MQKHGDTNVGKLGSDEFMTDDNPNRLRYSNWAYYVLGLIYCHHYKQ